MHCLTSDLLGISSLKPFFLPLRPDVNQLQEQLILNLLYCLKHRNASPRAILGQYRALEVNPRAATSRRIATVFFFDSSFCHHTMIVITKFHTSILTTSSEQYRLESNVSRTPSKSPKFLQQYRRLEPKDDEIGTMKNYVRRQMQRTKLYVFCRIIKIVCT